ncbi:MAG: glycerophosphodiester phosphodiesterase family protein [Flavobacteriales bacterium]
MKKKQLISLIILVLIFSCQKEENRNSAIKFDWQGHRGARGLMPENSVEGFLHALQFPVNTLELDVVISADSQIVVSHEPWFSNQICLCDREDNLFRKNYSEIQNIDCGSKSNAKFAHQNLFKTEKPTLEMVVNAVNNYCNNHGRELPFFNIEIKSRIEWDEIYTPKPLEFILLLDRELKRLKIDNKTCIQSFDTRILNEINHQKLNYKTAYLVENTAPIDSLLSLLNYTPDIYSPYYKLLSKSDVQKIKSIGMKVIPWTVNTKDKIKELINWGVDGIITDYPNLISEIELKNQ